MADNYLEKKMADYRSGRIGAQSKRRQSAGLKLPTGRVMVVGADCPDGRAVVRRFVEAGWSVVFTAADPAEGRRVAQECGGRFYPLSFSEIVADFERRNEAVGALVAFDRVPEDFPIEVPRKILIASGEVRVDDSLVAIQGCDPEQAAVLALIFAQPNSTVRGQVIRL